MLTNSRLAIICTHPIQYYTPVFRLLANEIELKVFYTAGSATNYDRGFNLKVDWDIPLLDGYNFHFLKNMAKDPGTHHFLGIITPDAIKIIQQYNPHYILVYGWASYSHFKILQYFKGKTTVLFRGDSTLLTQNNGLKKPIKKIWLAYIYRHVDKVLYVGSNNKSYFKAYGVKHNQLLFVPHAVDNNRFTFLHQQPGIRAQLKLSETDILILFTGKFIAVKNAELLLCAFQQLNLPNTKLLLVGSGPLANHLQRYRRSDTYFLPFQNQSAMPAVYQACDLFCMPSKSESWGLSVNEAMAAGKAIIVSDTVGCAMDLIKKSNGAVFKNNDLDNLKDQLKAMCTTREDLRIKGQVSRMIIAPWNFENQTKKIMDALQS